METKVKPLPLQIAELQEAVRKLNNENIQLRSYVNELGKMLGIPPLQLISEADKEGGVSNPVGQAPLPPDKTAVEDKEAAPQGNGDGGKTKTIGKKSPSSEEQEMPDNERVVYVPRMDILSGGDFGFIEDYFQEEESLIKLLLKGGSGKFEFTDDPMFIYDIMSNMQEFSEIADISIVEDIEDVEECLIVNHTPGSVNFDNGEWAVVSKARVKIEKKS